MPSDSEDEIDNCVFFGTPLINLLPEDTKFSVKPKRVEDQIVTDEKGRQRFHGAFTGGFSAGYFNTVGSKEGWAPSTFKSSRSERNSKRNQKPEDFMDEEDFSEYGIAPKSIQVKPEYKDETNNSTASARIVFQTNPADHALENLVRPSQNTIGVKMLRKMGWREGQGIGPRIKRKLRKLKTKLNNQPGQKLYGVTLPSESESDHDENLENEYLVSTYSTDEFQFEIKEDVFGLGYKRLDIGTLFGKNDSTSSSFKVINESPAASLLFPMQNKNEKKNNKKSISGQAFGVGDFEDDEDLYDVYKQDSIESYDFELGDSRQKHLRQELDRKFGFNTSDDELYFLKNFLRSDKKQEPPKVYPVSQVPQGFNLKHRLENKSRFDDQFGSNSSIKPLRRHNDKYDEMSDYISSVSKRADLLGEDPIQPDSVLDLVSTTNKEFLKSQMEASKTSEDKPSAAFQNKNNQQKKEKRYESYVSFLKKNYKDPYSFLDTKDMTEWEKEKEKEDFERRYQEHLKKIESIKKDTLKFVSLAKLTETNQEVITSELYQSPVKNTKIQSETEFIKPWNLIESESNTELTDLQRAAKERKYGEETRIEFLWRPHPVVCKRFNVKNPYPEAKELGTIKEERRKFVTKEFNMISVMSAASRFDNAKTKSLFDEINIESQMKSGLLQQRAQQQEPTPKYQQTEEVRVSTSATQKLEFDNKNVDQSSKSSILREEKSDDLLKVFKKELNELESIGIDLDNNIYLQERPSFDIFKEIFENEEETEQVAYKQEQSDQEQYEEIDRKSENEQKQINFESVLNQNNISILQSSIGDIDIEIVNKFLTGNNNKNNQGDDEMQSKNAEEAPTEKIIFKKLVGKLAKSISPSTSSTSNSSSDEVAYEEISISPSHKSLHGHHKKKKKKKKHKKKSKKDHKKSKN